MTTEQIINSGLNKTEKAKKLFEIGLTRKEVSQLVLNGNYGFAQNIYAKWVVNQIISGAVRTSGFNFEFNRTFGVEIEAYGVDKNELVTALRQVGIAVENAGYTHATTAYWKVVSDGSIRGNNAFELVSPILQGEAGLLELKKVCTVLKQKNALINKSCGLHIHFGVSNFGIKDWRNLYKTYAILEEQIDNFMPISRRADNNTYCKGLRLKYSSLDILFNKIDASRTVIQLAGIAATNGSRYCKVNGTSFSRHGTVEFRQHSGTIEYDKISNWILFLARMVDYSKKVGIAQNFNDFCTTEITTYITQRRAKLAA
jgi:Putative amidoligase enzyme